MARPCMPALKNHEPERYGFDLEKKLAPCRAALSESVFIEAETQGRNMTMEQTIAYALEDQE